MPGFRACLCGCYTGGVKSLESEIKMGTHHVAPTFFSLSAEDCFLWGYVADSNLPSIDLPELR